MRLDEAVSGGLIDPSTLLQHAPGILLHEEPFGTALSDCWRRLILVVGEVGTRHHSSVRLRGTAPGHSLGA